MEDKRFCLECKEELKGRSDQKFCDDACRNSYNNRKRAGSKQIVRKIDKTLHQNREILKKLSLGKKKATVRLALESEKFDFNYFTNIYKTKSGKIYYFCYDFGYTYIDGGKKILIVKKQDYI